LTALYWLFVGSAIGLFHVLTLWYTVAALEPARIGRALWLMCGGGLVRSVAAAALLTAAVNQGLSAGLFAAGGFLVSRLALAGVLGRRMVRT
jgi:hypothetical protein